MNKFGRSYRLRITSEDFPDIVIQDPITIKFTVQRRMNSAVNQMSCDLYNLSRETRDLLFQQPWVERRKKVILEGGYDEICTLFTGDLWDCYTGRNGPDIVTHMEVRSSVWDLKETTVYETLEARVTVRDLLVTVAGRFKGLGIGEIGDFPEKLLRPTVCNGNAWDIMCNYSNGTAYVDNGKIYALKRDEVIEGDLIKITPQTGLIETPKQVEVGVLQIQTLFEPRINVGQFIDLEADTQTVFNGQYKVIGVQHIGTISESEGGDLRTMLDLYVGYKTFKTVVANE